MGFSCRRGKAGILDQICIVNRNSSNKSLIRLDRNIKQQINDRSIFVLAPLWSCSTSPYSLVPLRTLKPSCCGADDWLHYFPPYGKLQRQPQTSSNLLTKLIVPFYSHFLSRHAKIMLHMKSTTFQGLSWAGDSGQPPTCKTGGSAQMRWSHLVLDIKHCQRSMLPLQSHLCEHLMPSNHVNHLIVTSANIHL